MSKQDTAPRLSEQFFLDSRLMDEAFVVGDMPLCRVLLMDNRLFPWLVLVPRRTDMVELIDLPVVDIHRLMDEIAISSKVMKAIVQPDKINVASLGNQVEQLHVHVIGRMREDAAWPHPVWGKTRTPYQPKEIVQILPLLQKEFLNKERLFKAV